MRRIPVITLDGPSGTGKGVLCHRLAEYFAWHCLDSGVLYRVLAYAATETQVSLDAATQLAELAQALHITFKSSEIFLNHKNVTLAIRTEACGQAASKVAVWPEVRAALLAKQRSFAKAPGLVTDGRDMGTVVFPDAMLKIFLTASLKVRAKRRHLQLKKNGINASLAQVVAELTERDRRDSSRENAPLKSATDAIEIDTTEMNVEQVFLRVLQLAREKLGAV